MRLWNRLRFFSSKLKQSKNPIAWHCVDIQFDHKQGWNFSICFSRLVFMGHELSSVPPHPTRQCLAQKCLEDAIFPFLFPALSRQSLSLSYLHLIFISQPLLVLFSARLSPVTGCFWAPAPTSWFLSQFPLPPGFPVILGKCAPGCCFQTPFLISLLKLTVSGHVLLNVSCIRFSEDKLVKEISCEV